MIACGRPPSRKQFVSLSEAISWIAFHDAMDSSELTEFLQCGRFEPQDSVFKPGVTAWVVDEGKNQAILSAVAVLVDRARGGSIELQGKFLANVLADSRDILTETIPSARFADFACFDTLDDSLHHGEGVVWGSNFREIVGLESDRHFRWVQVRREDLLRQFPSPKRPSVVSTGKAELECKDWLQEQFGLDPDRCRAKPSFRNAAIKHFDGRLSLRGFDRAWSGIAALEDRDKGGAKRKR